MAHDINTFHNIDSSASNIGGERTNEERFSELSDSLKKVALIFEKRNNDINDRLRIWIVIIAFFILLIFLFYYSGFHCDFICWDWSWRVAYKIAIRISSLAMLIVALSFSIKMLKSYINMLEHNKHKLAVINTMSSLVSSAITENQRETIYSKMIELVVKKENFGIMSKENDFKQFESLNKFIEKKLEDLK